MTTATIGGRAESLERQDSRKALTFLPAWSLQSLAEYVVVSLFFYLPLSMPLHIAVHQVVDHRAVWVSFAYPESVAILLLALVVFLGSRAGTLAPTARRDSSFRWLIGCACAYLVLAVTSGILQGSDLPFAVRKLAMQWALPIVLAISLRRIWSPSLDALIRRALIRGTFALLLLALVTYVLSFPLPRSFHELVFLNRTSLIWRGFSGGILFGEIPFGGVNPLAAHVATVSCLVIGSLFACERPRSKAFLVVWIGLAWLIQYLCFSRGTLLFLFAAVLAFAINGLALRGPRLSATVAGLTGALFLAATLPSGALAYWDEQFRFLPGSSAASRSSQWKHLAEGDEIAESEIPAVASEKMRENVASEWAREADDVAGREGATSARPSRGDPAERSGQEAYKALQKDVTARIGGPTRRLLIGYGVGNYGILRGLVPDSGSHNIFLDALLEAGVLGAISFALVFIFGFVRRVRGWLAARRRSAGEEAIEFARLLALASIAVIGVLVDYRLENLGTMTGAGILWFLVVRPPENA